SDLAGKDRHLGEACGIDEPGARTHARAARPVGREAGAFAGLERLDDRAQGGTASLARGAGDRRDAEILDRARDELTVQVARYQHVDAHASVPAIGHHQEASMPEGEDEGPALGPQALRSLGPAHAPAARRVHEADILRHRPTGDAPNPILSRERLERAHRSGPGPRSALARRRDGGSLALLRHLEEPEPSIEALLRQEL